MWAWVWVGVWGEGRREMRSRSADAHLWGRKGRDVRLGEMVDECCRSVDAHPRSREAPTSLASNHPA